MKKTGGKALLVIILIIIVFSSRNLIKKTISDIIDFAERTRSASKEIALTMKDLPTLSDFEKTRWKIKKDKNDIMHDFFYYFGNVDESEYDIYVVFEPSLSANYTLSVLSLALHDEMPVWATLYFRVNESLFSEKLHVWDVTDESNRARNNCYEFVLTNKLDEKIYLCYSTDDRYNTLEVSSSYPKFGEAAAIDEKLELIKGNPAAFYGY